MHRDVKFFCFAKLRRRMEYLFDAVSKTPKKLSKQLGAGNLKTVKTLTTEPVSF
jgi:hypothetical protein